MTDLFAVFYSSTAIENKKSHFYFQSDLCKCLVLEESLTVEPQLSASTGIGWGIPSPCIMEVGCLTGSILSELWSILPMP